MRIATCTPVDFEADAHFFGRDSGLLCRGFQAAGVSCVSIMPGVAATRDAPDLVRCSPAELCDAAWWRGLGLDMVILYAWGDPAHRHVADAIREAGILLIQSLDTAGLSTPYGDICAWWRCLTGMTSAPQPLSSRLRLFAKAVRDFFPWLYETRRLAMIDQSDRVAAVSPAAVASISRYATDLGFPQIAAKAILVPHPVPPVMAYDGSPKQNIVLTVGRWEKIDAAQKDPDMLLGTLKIFLEKHPDWRAVVVGRGGKALGSRLSDWSPHLRNQITWEDMLNREELALHYCRSSILLCPSRFESYHISSAEAICCGCSVVVAEHPLLASTSWFTTKESGTVVPERTPEGLADGLSAEVNAWSEGLRDATRISGQWISVLHADRVAQEILADTAAP